jgi:K+-sensing histidine kinase KdpD
LDLLVTAEDVELGIPEGEQELISKRFVRLNEKERGEVQGLGLARMKALVHGIGGEITLVSQGEIGQALGSHFLQLKNSERGRHHDKIHIKQ